MEKPQVADNKPAVLLLEPGNYAWCACGLSQNQPYCDGSHRGTAFRPQLFTLTESQQVALCQCKQTGNPPYCDGTHSTL